MFGKEPGTTIPRRCPSRITLATILTNVRIERFTVFTSNWYSTAVARSWLYRGGISVFSIWVLSRFYLSSVAILSEFYRGFFWRNFKNSKWAIFAGDKVDLHVCRIFRKKTKSGFESKKQKTFQKFKISNFHRRQSPVSTKFTVVPSSTTVTKTSLFHAENPSFSL